MAGLAFVAEQTLNLGAPEGLVFGANERHSVATPGGCRLALPTVLSAGVLKKSISYRDPSQIPIRAVYRGRPRQGVDL